MPDDTPPRRDPLLHRDLAGQVALVSGATRGIGARVAVALAELGAVVYAGARELSDLAGAEKELGGRIRPVQLDVTDEASVQAAVQQVITGRRPEPEAPKGAKAKPARPPPRSATTPGAGRLDILVNNAGVIDRKGARPIAFDAADFDRVLATNLRGAALLSREALPHLLQQPGGRIVNVASAMGRLSVPMTGNSPAYRMSKAALNALTAMLHGEYASRGLLANSGSPGWCRTDLGGDHAPRSPEEGADGIVWLCRFRPGSPSGLFWEDGQVVPW